MPYDNENAKPEQDGDSSLTRRNLGRLLGAGAMTAGFGALATGFGPAAFAAVNSAGEIVDGGAGMHGTMATAGMLATATVQSDFVSCGVGAMAMDTELIRQLPGMGMLGGLPLMDGSSGPFAMLMYSLDVASYDIDRPDGKVMARGMMRSITNIGGVTVEDITHEYLAVGIDGRDVKNDKVSVNFTTPFWTVGTNPLATPSEYVAGWSAFGGELLVGGINVGA